MTDPEDKPQTDMIDGREQCLKSLVSFSSRQRRESAFIHHYSDTFGSVDLKPRSDAKRVLVVSSSSPIAAETELCLVKALELDGWWSMPLIYHWEPKAILPYSQWTPRPLSRPPA